MFRRTQTLRGLIAFAAVAVFPTARTFALCEGVAAGPKTRRSKSEVRADVQFAIRASPPWPRCPAGNARSRNGWPQPPRTPALGLRRCPRPSP